MEKRASARRAQRRGEYGLHSRAFKWHMRWQAEYPRELLAKLGPAERAWLNQFQEEFHDCRFRAEPLHATQEEKRERYRAQDASNRCVLSRGLVDFDMSPADDLPNPTRDE
jgi:hypothetical protein